MSASIYGVVNSNRNFADPYTWGKNQFNSSFPVGLACFMRDQGYSANYIDLQPGGMTKVSEISFDSLFNSTLPNHSLRFDFESCFSPYQAYVEEDMEKIDLIVSEAATGKPLRPIEVKLTTLPDDATSNCRDESLYGSELVVRSPTIRYMALGMADQCKAFRSDIRTLFDRVCARIRDWGNVAEMKTHRNAIFSAMNSFLECFREYQLPLLMQPVWKTKGQLPELADNCLDIFVWSDFAIARMLLDNCDCTLEGIPRQQRAILRLARFLYEYSTRGKVFQAPIFDGMTFDTLNDKEFAVSGRKTNRYMACPRLTTPMIHKQSIHNIVLGEGQKYLSPERRFDAILYYSTDLFD